MAFVWSSRDQEQIRARGMTLEQVGEQLARFERGFPPLVLDRPCTVGDGIHPVADAEMPLLEARFHEAKLAGRISKFVPASGAASRMFHSLLVARNEGWPLEEDALKARNDEDARFLREFFERLEEFPFAEQLLSATSRLLADATPGATSSVHEDASSAVDDRDASRVPMGAFRQAVLQALLTPQGLGFADLPKGLILFHRYGSYVRTAFEEHLMQSLPYISSADGAVRLHFTVPTAYRSHIDQQLRACAERLLGRFEISFSVQDPASDTIAVDQANQPARDAQGDLIFRPGGHGALLRNLEGTHSDLVFLRNVDNIAAEHPMRASHLHRERMGGLLLAVQEGIDALRTKLMDEARSTDGIPEALSFLERVLSRRPAPSLRTAPPEAQVAYLLKEFTRPLRVCGMVRNQGEPGGGPFWVQHSDGSSSIQIVEKAQIQLRDDEQRKILESSTHFNPVDLVCSLRSPEGVPYRLSEFADPDSGIITEKTTAGKTLRALEWPGLWNGAMARWSTVFMEIPLECFNPVKTVLDLLRPAHRG